MPRFLIYIGVILFLTSTIPLAMVFKARYSRSDQPRIHPIWHMDDQESFKAQQANTFFLDGRASRLPVEGTIARVPAGVPSLGDEYYYTGLLDPTQPAADGNYIRKMPQSVLGRDPGPDGLIGTRDDIALKMTREFVERGQQRFNIYCAVCHGRLGNGQGLTHQRAVKLIEAGTMPPGWTPPASLLVDTVVAQPDGYLFNSITSGVRNMPAYGSQIPVQDRWAIVAYVRALQRAASGSLADVEDQSQKQLLIDGGECK